ncbi:MAG: SDR family oxidoreductase [Moraxellaceae bacterium]|nr:SDR family oxidoreductase [Moraxellaceae bacterium]
MSIFQPGLLKGQTAFITGGSSGINFGIARRYAEHGANVAIVARNPEKLEAARAALADTGARILALSADVRDYGAMENAATQTREAFGEIDIVLAGAAGNFMAPAAQMSANAFAAVVGIDLLGTFNTFRSTMAHLRRPGARGLVISAPQAVNPTPMQTHVCAAKSGIEAFIKSAAIEWGALGMRINGLSPGGVEGTEGLQRLSAGGLNNEFAATLPIPRYATVDEMADMALVLVSPLSAYMTGHVVALDGGISLLGGSYSMAWLRAQQGR